MIKLLLSLVFMLQAALPKPEIGYTLLSQGGEVFGAFATMIGTPVTAAINPLLAPAVPDATVAAKGQTLTTPVYDALTDTYTDVTTIRGDNETVMDFIRRHNKIVDALLDENIARATAKAVDYKAAKKEHDHPSS
jgi:hypothetical protein